MRIGFFQFAPKFGDKETNLAKVASAITGVKADLLVLPELFNTGYSFCSRRELQELAEEIPDGTTTRTLQTLARRTGITLVGGIAERWHRKLYNSALMVTPQGDCYCYRKIHLFVREKFLFERGNSRPEVWRISSSSDRKATTGSRRPRHAPARVGVIVCFDYFFPELARTLALSGAQIICHPANLILPYAQQVTITRALENRIFWILCNRTGSEKSGGQELHFTGLSQIVDPAGNVLAQAGRSEEVVKVVEIDHRAADNKVIFKNDLFKDRCPELYFL